jgi:hypothetical protein
VTSKQWFSNANFIPKNGFFVKATQQRNFYFYLGLENNHL